MSNAVAIHAISFEDICAHEMCEWIQYPENRIIDKKINRKEWKKRQKSKLRRFIEGRR